MSVIKCKMCGGDLRVIEGKSVAECEYCGSLNTLPNDDDEKKLTLLSRANRLRANCEFDKAAGVYEQAAAEFPREAEAYWGLVLCRYGIEYVDDPATGKKVPTCHRSSFDSVFDDADFEQACENADAVARRVYRDGAKEIEEIRKGILEVSGREQPYDIFICYKERDENKERTVDSVIAQEIYDELTKRGYRVFFSRITLEDKLGQEYEPYIFAALNSAKLMLAVGTDYEYYNAVWVKNEWSRFLKLMERDKSRRLIPCFKGLDAYDMPREFAHLQAQDMGKVGAMQDLLRGIEKIIPRKEDKPEKQTQPQAPAIIQQSSPTVQSLLKRATLFLRDCDWSSASKYFDNVLDIVPENGEAYAGKLCAKLKSPSLQALGKTYISNTKHEFAPNNGLPPPPTLSSFGDYKKAKEYSDQILLAVLKQQEAQVKDVFRKLWKEKLQSEIACFVSETKKLKNSLNEAQIKIDRYAEKISYKKSALKSHNDTVEYVSKKIKKVKKIKYVVSAVVLVISVAICAVLAKKAVKGGFDWNDFFACLLIIGCIALPIVVFAVFLFLSISNVVTRKNLKLIKSINSTIEDLKAQMKQLNKHLDTAVQDKALLNSQLLKKQKELESRQRELLSYK